MRCVRINFVCKSSSIMIAVFTPNKSLQKICTSENDVVTCILATL